MRVSGWSGGLPALECSVCDQPKFNCLEQIWGMEYQGVQDLVFLLARTGPRETAAVCLCSREVEWADSIGGRRFLRSRTRRRRIPTTIEIERPSEVSSCRS